MLRINKNNKIIYLMLIWIDNLKVMIMIIIKMIKYKNKLKIK